MNADALVERLAIQPFRFHAVHEDVLRGHKGHLLPEVLFTDRGIDCQPPCHVDHKIQNGISGQKGLRDRQPPIGGVVQRPLQPLG